MMTPEARRILEEAWRSAGGSSTPWWGVGSFVLFVWLLGELLRLAKDTTGVAVDLSVVIDTFYI
jgi:hypothetical protein